MEDMNKQKQINEAYDMVYLSSGKSFGLSMFIGKTQCSDCTNSIGNLMFQKEVEMKDVVEEPLVNIDSYDLRNPLCYGY